MPFSNRAEFLCSLKVSCPYFLLYDVVMLVDLVGCRPEPIAANLSFRAVETSSEALQLDSYVSWYLQDSDFLL